MVAVALFGFFCTGIFFLAHAVDACHARRKARGLSPGIFSRRRRYLFGRANWCFVGLDLGNRAAGGSLAAHRAPD